MNDVFVVVSETWDGRRKARCVLAGDEDQAVAAHQARHPDDRIVAVKAQG